MEKAGKQMTGRQYSGISLIIKKDKKGKNNHKEKVAA
jgi:hypothetical protein